MSRAIRRTPQAPLDIDFSYSQLSDEEMQTCCAAHQQERDAERTGDRARRAKAREFHFVGGML